MGAIGRGPLGKVHATGGLKCRAASPESSVLRLATGWETGGTRCRRASTHTAAQTVVHTSSPGCARSSFQPDLKPASISAACRSWCSNGLAVVFLFLLVELITNLLISVLPWQQVMLRLLGARIRAAIDRRPQGDGRCD
jgi:hypothetical protein